jgi:hypothetical protein
VERLNRDKRCIFYLLVNYEEKKFYNIKNRKDPLLAAAPRLKGPPRLLIQASSPMVVSQTMAPMDPGRRMGPLPQVTLLVRMEDLDRVHRDIRVILVVNSIPAAGTIPLLPLLLSNNSPSSLVSI